MCYKLTFHSADGEDKEYWGMTEALAGHTLDSALDVRLEYHRTKRVLWLAGADPETFRIYRMGGIRSLQEALEMEVVYTVLAFAARPKQVRGGAWVLRHLRAADRCELATLTAALCPLQNLDEKQHKLRKLVPKFPIDGHLRRHLSGQCFSCGGPLGQRCRCRTRALACVTVSAETAASRSRPAGEAKREPKKFRRAAKGDAKKSRSGTRCSGTPGHSHRVALGVQYGTKVYFRMKYGSKEKPRRAMTKHQRTYRATKPVRR